MSTPRDMNSAKVQTLAQRMVLQLLTVLRTHRIHDPGNKALLVATENLKDSINTLWATARGTVRLQFLEGEAFVNDVRLRFDPGLRDQVLALEAEMAQRELGGLAFGRPLDSASLQSFLLAFTQPVENTEDLERMRASLIQLRELAIELIDPKDLGDIPEEVRIDKKTFALQTYAKAIVAVRELAEALRAGREPDSRLRLTRIVMDLVDIATERVNFLLRLSAIKSAHDYPYNHAANTCVLAIVIGRSLGIDRLALVDLGTAALVADLGFALLPDELTEKSHEMSPEEREELRRRMLGQIRTTTARNPLNAATLRRIIVAYEHHLPFSHPRSGERGYTHLFSRIVQVADAFDALTTQRPWREGYTPDEALRVLVQDAGRTFDPVVVKVLVNLLGMYPLGSLVRLGSGELAVVYHNGTDPTEFERPWVRVLVDSAGQVIRRTVIRNLASVEGPEGRIASTARASEAPGLDLGMALFV